MRTDVVAPFAATVAEIVVDAGAMVEEGQTVLFLEIMKMEQPVPAPVAGTVGTIDVTVGQTVEAGEVLLVLATGEPTEHDAAAPEHKTVQQSDREVRADLAAVQHRRAQLQDQARADAVAKRHSQGHRTARENIDDLVDEASFSEYGGLVIASQRSRRSLTELQQRTPADGLITGTATVGAAIHGVERSRVAVVAYDYTVLAGTQGWANHRKLDRLLDLADREALPVIVFAEGGGGRPGDDYLGASLLEAQAWELLCRLSGRVPLIAVVNGRCFAGNAALAGACDVIIATMGSSLGMAGPAMIEGGGLGSVHPDEVGPMEVQTAGGVVDVLVEDEAAAVAEVTRVLGFWQGPVPPEDRAGREPDPALLREAVPENRKRVYDMRQLLETLVDPGSLVELRGPVRVPGAADGAWQEYAPGMATGFARIAGRPVGILANIPTHLGGAIDAEAADSATRHLQLCDSYRLPIVVLCDTPGFMVGPEAERDGGVRRFSQMFLAGSRLTVPVIAVITRKGYGLGAQAMMGGHLNVPLLTLAWPTAELGPMGLEGAVSLGYRRELAAIEDPATRAAREAELIDQAYATAGGLNVASFGEIDDVIDPADTRLRIVQALTAARPR